MQRDILNYGLFLLHEILQETNKVLADFLLMLVWKRDSNENATNQIFMEHMV